MWRILLLALLVLSNSANASPIATVPIEKPEYCEANGQLKESAMVDGILKGALMGMVLATIVLRPWMIVTTGTVSGMGIGGVLGTTGYHIHNCSEWYNNPKKRMH